MLTKFTHIKHESNTVAGYVYIYDIPARNKYPKSKHSDKNKNRNKFKLKI